MLRCDYEYAGCKTFRIFKDVEELNDWIQRQLRIDPDTIIIDVKDEEGY